MSSIQISFPESSKIALSSFERLEVVGIHPDASKQSPVVFTETYTAEEFKALETYQLKEEFLAKIDRLQFNYIHTNKQITGWWFKQVLERKEPKIKITLNDSAKKNWLLSGELTIELVKVDKEPCRIILPSAQSTGADYVEIPLSAFLSCSELAISYKLENGETEVISYKDKAKAVYKPEKEKHDHFECVRINRNTGYENSEDGRYLCLLDLDARISHAHALSGDVNGDGNLLYYCVYFSSGYVELFNNSLLSIVEQSSMDFDVLVITDLPTKKKIEETAAAKKVKLKYMLTDTPADGVEASKRKLSVFDFENIFAYSNVLFLDCDTVAVGDVSDLFKLQLSSNLFYGVKPGYVNFWHIKSPYHGFKTLSDDFVEEMRLAKQYTFNAGQFMFRPSMKMHEHFNNVKWFMQNWPSEYFFEQCFMGYYFCKAYISEVKTVTPFFNLLNVSSDIPAMSESTQERVFHFTAPPLDAKTKLTAIKKFTEGLKPKTTKLTLKDKFLNLFKPKN